MRGWFHRGRLLLGAAALGVALTGCASQHDESLRLSEELGRARADAAWQQSRAATLEERMSRLEQTAGVALSARRPEERELLGRIDRLIEQNERLLVQRDAPATSSSAASAAPASALSPEEELRALVERMRGRPGHPHGGLTREQEAALRVLTRPERKLDTENLWPAAFY